VIAQLGVTDMRLPIQYAFSYPERWDGGLPSLDIGRLGTLDFSPPDVERFRCLSLAYQALEAGGPAPIVLNAVNEVAVAAFLAGQLPFLRIPALIEDALAAVNDTSEPASLADVRAVDTDAAAIRLVRQLVASLNPACPLDQIHCGPLDALPWADGSTDAVICSAVLHFARDEAHFRAMLAGTWRTLKPGGLLFCRLASSIGLISSLYRREEDNVPILLSEVT
jgi:hypothetical protein